MRCDGNDWSSTPSKSQRYDPELHTEYDQLRVNASCRHDLRLIRRQSTLWPGSKTGTQISVILSRYLVIVIAVL